MTRLTYSPLIYLHISPAHHILYTDISCTYATLHTLHMCVLKCRKSSKLRIGHSQLVDNILLSHNLIDPIHRTRPESTRRPKLIY